MKTMYFLAAIYFALALYQSVNDSEDITVYQKLSRFVRAAIFPATWIYDIVKSVINYYKK